MDEFYEWLKECYHKGELTEVEVEEALQNKSKAYNLFMECFHFDPVGTGEMAQVELVRLKNQLHWERTHNVPKT